MIDTILHDIATWLDIGKENMLKLLSPTVWNVMKSKNDTWQCFFNENAWLKLNLIIPAYLIQKTLNFFFTFLY